MESIIWTDRLWSTLEWNRVWSVVKVVSHYKIQSSLPLRDIIRPALHDPLRSALSSLELEHASIPFVAIWSTEHFCWVSQMQIPGQCYRGLEIIFTEQCFVRVWVLTKSFWRIWHWQWDTKCNTYIPEVSPCTLKFPIGLLVRLWGRRDTINTMIIMSPLSAPTQPAPTPPFRFK